ncbi:MAG: DnaJ domain-containing protein [Dissulfuribacterales bacterium]
MNVFWVIAAFILLLLYIVSPIDGIPDVIPVLGWLDDTFLLGLFVYYLRYGRLPGFMSWINRLLLKKSNTRRPDYTKTSNQRENSSGHIKNEDSAYARDPYEILGVKLGASTKEIHAAYRDAVQKYHPDKVSHLGKELQDLAKIKFVEIQEAYDFLTGKKS